MSPSIRPVRGARRERGATLVTVLVLLLVMTLLGLVGMRTTLLEERMSSSQRDRSLAFQAAEAALRTGEDLVGSTRPTYADGCATGKCGFPDPSETPVWEVAANWDAAPAITAYADDQALPAKYIVELIADRVTPKGTCTTTGDITEDTCTGFERRYRVTARSLDEDNDESGRAAVTLQSIYAVP